jgi:hypothetical protein
MELFAHGGLLAANLLSPIVLAFLIGIIAGLMKSELEFPQPVLNAISIYLVLAIGIAGGVELSQADLAAVWRPALLAAGLALALPAWCYWILRRSGRFAISDAASLAAHYGSVSSVTFMAAITFATRASEAANDPSLRPEAFLPVLASLMEWGLLVALFIGHWRLARAGSLVQAPFGSLVLDALRARSVVLMLGGFLLGWLVGEKGFAPIKPVFADRPGSSRRCARPAPRCWRSPCSHRCCMGSSAPPSATGPVSAPAAPSCSGRSARAPATSTPRRRCGPSSPRPIRAWRCRPPWG